MKTKSGLQKPISSIFESFPQTNIIKNDEPEMPSASSIQTHEQLNPVVPSEQTVPPDQIEEVMPISQELNVSPPVQYSDLIAVETDKKPKQQLWFKNNLLAPVVAAVFAMVIILTAAGMMGVFTKYESVAAASTPATPKASILQEIPVINWQILEKVDVSSRNITQAGDDGQGAEESIDIKGIIYGSEKSMVIIGTKVCKIGDTVAGAKIINIERKSVEFEKDNDRWTQTIQ